MSQSDASQSDVSQSDDRTGTGADDILTAPEVAAMLKVPVTTVYKLTREGKLPAARVGKHWRYLRMDLIQQIRRDAAQEQRAAAAERRRHRRVPWEADCEFSVAVDSATRCDGQGVVRNLSRSGAMLSIDRLVVQGRLVRIDDPILLHVSDDTSLGTAIGGEALRGRVVHVQNDKSTFMGIAFEGLADEAAGRIDELIGGVPN